MWKSEINIRTLEKNNLLAFYLAQAGIEEAKIAARYGEITADSGWNDFGAGRYSYGIADVGANKRELTGTGQIVGGGGNPAAMRQIKMLIKGIENPNSDTTNDAKEDWSWREL